MNKLQKNLLEQPCTFKYFFENHPDGIYIVDDDGHILNVNASALNMLGYTREEILQTSLDRQVLSIVTRMKITTSGLN